MLDEGYQPKLGDKVLLPRKLTAENGAKQLLVGEFYEEMEEECHECGDMDYEEDPDYACDVCGGQQTHTVRVGVSWQTINAIYDKIVKHYGDQT